MNKLNLELNYLDKNIKIYHEKFDKLDENELYELLKLREKRIDTVLRLHDINRHEFPPESQEFVYIRRKTTMNEFLDENDKIIALIKLLSLYIW